MPFTVTNSEYINKDRCYVVRVYPDYETESEPKLY
jgi:hypothetical protein